MPAIADIEQTSRKVGFVPSRREQMQRWMQLLDHFVGAQEQGGRYFHPNRLGSPQIDDRPKSGWQLDRKIGGL
jgi:hypothetical protein